MPDKHLTGEPIQPDEGIERLENAIAAIAAHPTLDTKAKLRGIKSLRAALARLTEKPSAYIQTSP